MEETKESNVNDTAVDEQFQDAEDDGKEEDVTVQVDGITADIKKLFKEPLTFAFDEESNFTWEHFFTTHCGILPEDALKYEKSLIAHRMNPLDTLHESIALIIEYGKIPVGDKLKIVKTINNATDAMQRGKNQMEDARKNLGLQEYNDFDAGVILNMANGDTEDHIDYAIEQFEDGKKEMERWLSFSMLKDPKVRESYTLGVKTAQSVKNPAFELLSHFGYKSFEYTYGKDTLEVAVPATASSSNPVLDDILLGNCAVTTSSTGEGDENPNIHMYS